jgi:Leucine-rich repeat (LRR) protein
LNLSINNLSSLPDNITKFGNLKVIFLSENEFSELPPALFNLTELNWLHLYGNDLQNIPHEITNLKKLSVIDLRENKALPKEFQVYRKHQVQELLEQMARK